MFQYVSILIKEAVKEMFFEFVIMFQYVSILIHKKLQRIQAELILCSSMFLF